MITDHPKPMIGRSPGKEKRLYDCMWLLSFMQLPAMILSCRKARFQNEAAADVPQQCKALLRIGDKLPIGQSILRIDSQWIMVWACLEQRRQRLIFWYPMISPGVEKRLQVLQLQKRGSQAFETSIAGLTHDIRTPLNIITGLSQMLENDLRGTSMERAQSWVSLIRAEADQIARLVEELIGVVRINHGVFQPRRMAGDIIAHMHMQSRLLSPLFSTHNISMSLPDASDKCMLRYDHMMFERIFQNILSNAVRFTPPNGHVDVCLQSIPNGVQISITDNGCGIDPSLSKDIFELHKTGGGGYGLGLYLARAMAQAHGGDVRVVPRENGAHFIVTLMNS